MAVSPGATLRERKPLVHQITNYVVMNETANATLALGALPVMAHAPEEVEEMASVAGALVLNIGTLSEHWIEAMLLAGQAANAAGVPSCSIRSARARRGCAPRRKRRDGSSTRLEIAVVRGNAAEIATLAGRTPRSAGSSRSARRRLRRRAGARSRRDAARALGCVVSVTGPVDHVSDGERVIAVANGHELLGTVTGTGCMSTAITGCFLACQADEPARGGGRGARRVRRRRRGRRARRARPGDLSRGSLRRPLQPRPGHARLRRR